jgi:hypothetical protein
LASGAPEGRSVPEVVALDAAAERLRGRQGRAVARVDVADAALGHHHQRLLVDAVLPGEMEQVQAAAQQARLETGLVSGRDDAAVGQRAAA